MKLRHKLKLMWLRLTGQRGHCVVTDADMVYNDTNTLESLKEAIFEWAGNKGAPIGWNGWKISYGQDRGGDWWVQWQWRGAQR